MTTLRAFITGLIDTAVANKQGPAGPAGSSGPAGPQGPVGPVGPRGLTGPAGPQGEASSVPGPVGPQGPAGPKGDKGDTGAASTVPGPTGPQGPQGPKGDTGAAGPAGPASTVPGPQGPQGPKGDTGAASTVPGPAGPQGPKGDTGDAGPAGPQGPVGPQGPAGVSGGGGTGLLPFAPVSVPWVKRVASYWSTSAATSGIAPANSLRALPFDTLGLDVTAVTLHVQGSITAGQTISIGIYESTPEGLPGALVWDSGGLLISAMGTGTRSTATPRITGPRRRLWVATYLSAGTTQFVINVSSPLAYVDMGWSTNGSVNGSALVLLSSSTWSGAMPSTFEVNLAGAAVLNGTCPNPFLQLAPPL